MRKIDPGEKFPWKKLRKNKIGIWHGCETKFLEKFRRVKISNKSKLQFAKKLKKIGYCFSIRKKVNLLKITKAFQRHYRQELISGIIDMECLIIAKKLLKNS